MNKKQCSKCKEKKELSFFNKQDKTKDGLCYWCKECHAGHQRTYRKTLVGSTAVRRYATSKGGKVAKLRGSKKHRLLCPEKVTAQNAWRRFAKKTNIIIPKSYEAHHYNYHYPTDIICLSKEKHIAVHTDLVYDQKFMCYRTLEGALLDTKRKHLNHIFPSQEQ